MHSLPVRTISRKDRSHSDVGHALDRASNSLEPIMNGKKLSPVESTGVFLDGSRYKWGS